MPPKYCPHRLRTTTIDHNPPEGKAYSNKEKFLTLKKYLISINEPIQEEAAPKMAPRTSQPADPKAEEKPSHLQTDRRKGL